MISRLLIACKIGLSEILNNKMRSFLSIFAVSIGVFTFIFVFSSINYAKKEENKLLSILGRNTILMRLEPEQSIIIRLDFNHLKEIFSLSKDILSVSPFHQDFIFFPFEGTFSTAKLAGITPAFTKINWLYKLKEGRMITWDDVLEKRKVAVLVKDPPSNRGNGDYPTINLETIRTDFKWIVYNKAMLGKQINFMQDYYTIVGVLEAPLYKNDFRINPQAYDFLLPITSLKDTEKNLGYAFAFIEVNHPENVNSVKAKLTAYLRKKHGNREEKFKIEKVSDIAAEKRNAIRQNILLISVLGLIAMISGGVGIMNVILATIYARTKEIGIRRAIGASKADIFWQFSFEAIALNILGACAGYIITLFAIDYTSKIIKMQTDLDVYAILYAFLLAGITGFLFSLYPAIKAAGMNPIESLKSE